MKKLISSMNFNPEDFPPEKLNKKSETQPDQVYTIREILERVKRGEKIQNSNVNWQEDLDEEYENPLKPDMDLTDVDNIKKVVSETKGAIKKAKDKIEEFKKKKAEKHEKPEKPESELEQELRSNE